MVHAPAAHDAARAIPAGSHPGAPRPGQGALRVAAVRRGARRPYPVVPPAVEDERCPVHLFLQCGQDGCRIRARVVE